MAQAYLTAGLTTFRWTQHGSRRAPLRSPALSGAFGWGVLLAVFGVSPAAFAAPDHIGAERCGACHQAQYESWKKSPHANALARLSEEQQQDPYCRSCHTMDPWSQEPALAGVQCESCHGAGRAYAPEVVMRDARLAKLLGLAPIKESTCATCHRSDAPRIRPFNYAEMVKRVMHPEPTEPDAPGKAVEPVERPKR